MIIQSDRLQDVLNKLFLKHNFTEKKAKLLAKTHMESTLDGVNSHGINRVPLFIKYIEKGLINVDAEAEKIASFGNIERWDGHHGSGILNANKCTNRSVELAKMHGRRHLWLAGS